jgi:hypothetical protein
MLTTNQRKRAALLRRIDREQQAQRDQKPVDRMVITVEWVKSTTWGMNPHASADIYYSDGSRSCDQITARCSGTGYDKLSTVVAEICNKTLAYLLWQPNTLVLRPYGISHYASDRDRPQSRYYECGVGLSCYTAAAMCAYLGGRFEHIANTARTDVIVWESAGEIARRSVAV